MATRKKKEGRLRSRLNVKGLRGRRKKTQQAMKNRGRGGGGDIGKVGDNEEIVFFICPPLEYNPDETCHVEYFSHFQVGKDDGSFICLDIGEGEESLFDIELVQEYLDKRGIKVDENTGCPSCEVLEDEEADFMEGGRVYGNMERMQAGFQSFWCVVPIAKWEDNQRVLLPKDERVPRIYRFPHSACEAIWDILERDGDDVIDPDGAQLVTVKHVTKGKGQKKRHTYTAVRDKDTTKKPYVITEKLWASIEEAQKEGGELDLFRLFANFVKPRAAMEAALRGVEYDEDSDSGSGGDTPRSCYGMPKDFDAEDEACQGCPFKHGCANEIGVEAPEDLDDDFEAAEGYEAENYKKADKPKRKSKPEPEPEEKPKRKPKRKPKPAPKPDPIGEFTEEDEPEEGYEIVTHKDGSWDYAVDDEEAEPEEEAEEAEPEEEAEEAEPEEEAEEAEPEAEESDPIDDFDKELRARRSGKVKEGKSKPSRPSRPKPRSRRKK